MRPNNVVLRWMFVIGMVWLFSSLLWTNWTIAVRNSQIEILKKQLEGCQEYRFIKELEKEDE